MSVNKFSWFVFVVLVSCIGWLVMVNWAPRDNDGLECVYNCDGYNVMIESLNSPSVLKMSHSAYSVGDLQPATPVQFTKNVQMTQSSAMLHDLSKGVEMLPIEMLRSGQLVY